MPSEKRFAMTQTLSSPVTESLPPMNTRRRQTIASLFGERSFEFVDWRQLIQDGVLVRLHIGGSSVFSTRLTLEDVGVHVENDEARDKISKWLVLGTKRLLPRAYMQPLQRLESGARYALKE